MNLTAKKLREAANYMAGSGANSAHAIATVRRLFNAVPSDTFGGDLGLVLNVIADELDELQARAAEANDLHQQLESAEDKAERRKRHIGYLDTALHDKNVLFKQRGEALAKVTEENAELRKQVPSERERAILDMWPRFEDGELVMPGDKVHYASTHNVETEIEVESITVMDGLFVLCDDECRSNQYEQGQRVKRPALKVLDADGVEIKLGDTVWFRSLSTGDRMRKATVTGFGEHSLGGPLATLKDEMGWTCHIDPKKVTHVQPDSWERFVEDMQKSACAYFGYQHKECDEGDGCPARGALDCSNRKMADLISRAKALAGIGVGE